MLLIKNIGRLITFDDEREGDLGAIDQAAVLIEGNTVAWIGREEDRPAHKISQIVDAEACVVTPGFIDCHSHLVFAGSRADEFALRMQGESYENIMKNGGGIMSTVLATSACADEELLALAGRRAGEMLTKGVTTLEVKSGYGLNIAAELRILRIIKKLSHQTKIDLHPTFLGAHMVPPRFHDNRKAYVDEIIHDMLPAVAQEKLAIDCDVFCERGAFDLREAKAILSRASELGFGLRAHVQQLGNSDGVKLIEELPIKSISHADFLSSKDIQLISQHKTIVESLPFAALFLRSKQVTPVELLREAGVKLAIATDFNPGSAMCNDLILAARLGVTYCGFHIPEALSAITKNAGLSLGRKDIGHISPQGPADLVITNCTSIEEIFYDWSKHPVKIVLKNGQVV